MCLMITNICLTAIVALDQLIVIGLARRNYRGEPVLTIWDELDWEKPTA